VGLDRLLPMGNSWKNTRENTPDWCVRHCRDEGHSYAGLQYGSQCLCSDAKPEGKSDESQCNYACAGDSSIKMCGGFGFINMFYTDNRTTMHPACGNTTEDIYYQEWFEDVGHCSMPDPDEGFPESCSLSVDGSKYSIVDGGISILEQDCTVKEPARWAEWCQHYFGVDWVSPYGDNDNDGLSNILEYYADVNPGTTTDWNENLGSLPVDQIGCDPTNIDTDGDLLLDGFEWFYGMDPKGTDSTTDDWDSDGQNNLNEQILGTDPNNADSDGDGNPDGYIDPTDPVPYAEIKLTVGDWSGSHSERYILHLGDISHQSPGYGLVGDGTYAFHPGTYEATLQHYGSTVSPPDFDYTMLIEKVGGNATVTIEDPEGILGDHGESSYFYADGKHATVIVEAA